MFRTIISEAYKFDEREKIYEYIDDLCSPKDTYGWSSNGIYCYWNYYTKEILYIGLARDLGERFRQHNGLVSCNENSCKIMEIKKYFEENEKIGFSIIVQSPLAQMTTFKNSKESFFNIESIQNEEYRNNLSEIEGKLISAHEKCFGHIPKWNKINGELKNYELKNTSIFKYLTLKEDSILNARVSLKELSESPEYTFYETYLHGVKLMNKYEESPIFYKKMIEEFKKFDLFSDMRPYNEIYNYIKKRVEI